jgi:hypothetical protein
MKNTGRLTLAELQTKRKQSNLRGNLEAIKGGIGYETGFISYEGRTYYYLINDNGFAIFTGSEAGELC